MDFARHPENPYERHGLFPKLILAGRLTGTLDGRPVVISAAEQTISVYLSGLRSAWGLRKQARGLLGTIRPGLQFLADSGLRLECQIGAWPMVELLPAPGLFTSLLIPGLPRGPGSHRGR
jgi:hypothetical protein